MKTLIWLGAVAMSAVPFTPALAQNPAPALSPAEVDAGLSGGEVGIIGPDILAAMLLPSSGPTRSLKGGQGAAPGEGKRGGVIPDLRVRFDTNSARITPQAGRQLAALALAMQFPQLEELRFVIAGHTDARGSEPTNQALSQRRAEAVVGYLVRSYAIAPDRLEAVGYGEARLADPADPASGKNRRVEVRVD